MGLTRSYFITLCLCVVLLNELHLPRPVTCDQEQNSQCIPKRVFLTLLRLRQVRSNLAAYSRSAQDAQNRNDMANLKALTEEGDDTEVCIPAAIYLDLFKDPALRGHLSVIGRTQKLPDILGRLLDTADQTDSGDSIPQPQTKRSIATLAKNDDLPISFHDRQDNDDDEKKRSTVVNEHMDAVLRRILTEESRRAAAQMLHEYLLPNGEYDLESLIRDYSLEKRNPRPLPEDTRLPFNRRNIASLARGRELPNGKRNVGALARDGLLPISGKRNIAAMARTSILPQNGKRNIASLARDNGLPYGKRYEGSVLRSEELPVPDDGNNVYLFERDEFDWPGVEKKGVSVPANVMLQILRQHGGSGGYGTSEKFFMNDGARGKVDSVDRKFKREIDYSEEYPLPVMQTSNVLDYEDLYDAFTEQHPSTEKRFMGSEEEVPADVTEFGYPETFRPSKRHIGALARLGWLPSGFRAARFSRSPRYDTGRENSADGSPTDDSTDQSTRPLRLNLTYKTPYFQALDGDCRHGFRRFVQLPMINTNVHRKFHRPPSFM